MGDLEQLQEDLDDLVNVEDAEEDVSTTGDLFSISSFGVDYPVETLVSRMEKKLFYIPPFQRAFVWSQNQCSRFIESLLLGLPVPGIFLFKEADSGKHLVIDGQQRLKSLHYFIEAGTINGKEFALTELKTKFGGNCILDKAALICHYNCYGYYSPPLHERNRSPRASGKHPVARWSVLPALWVA